MRKHSAVRQSSTSPVPSSRRPSFLFFPFHLLCLAQCYNSSFVSHRLDRLLYKGALDPWGETVATYPNQTKRERVVTRMRERGRVPALFRAPPVVYFPRSMPPGAAVTSIQCQEPRGNYAKGPAPGPGREPPKETAKKKNKMLPCRRSSFMRVRERGNLYTSCHPSGMFRLHAA